MVFIGGAIGTMLRHLIGEVFGSSYEFPTSEFLALGYVNLIGSYALGLIARHPLFGTESRRAFFGTGLAGGFTTMSALTLFIDNQGLSREIALLLFIGPATYAFGWHQGRRKAKKVGHE